jgi:hypothetical protein
MAGVSPPEGFPKLRQVFISIALIERHGITQALVRVGNAAAVEADVLRMFGKLLDLIEQLLACQHAKMARMVPCADIFLHVTPSPNLKS